MIRDQGDNSLYDILYKSGVGEDVESSYEYIADSQILFSVTCNLTDQGKDSGVWVVGVILSYVEKVRGEGVGEWYWEELRGCNEMEFRWVEKKKGGSYVEKVNEVHGGVRDRDVLRQEYLFGEFDEALVTEQLGLLTLENSFVVYISEGVKFGKGVKKTKDVDYEFQYSVEDFDKE